jgi:maltose alpha-D-glucosyltransferase/alpha-amylase
MKPPYIAYPLFKISLLLSLLILIIVSCSQQHDTSHDPSVLASDSLRNNWYKKAIIYTLDVEVFKDSDNDGTGDFNGLISRLGYIDSLGTDAIWLAPFQPTPNRDDGYDISDYYRIDPRLGSMEDFDRFIQAASSHHIKVIMDLVVNHSSDEHPWFAQARSNRKSVYRDWYTWSSTKPGNYDVGMVFPGVQESIWTLDSVSKEYYYHRFYKFQPDLNMQNERVRSEVKKIIRFWIQRGIKGFRLDAVPFVIEVPKTKGDNFDRQFDILTEMRQLVDSLDHEAIILGEANVMPKESKDYFGEHGDGINMMFNFYVNQHLFYALATGKIEPLRKALSETHKIPPTAAWGQFIRNHDEVDLGRLTDQQREEVYKAMGPEKNMQLYDRGIRRRLAPMLNNDRKRIELAYSMLLALPSTPVMRYGDEIGMGDDLRLKERMSVRTPMQWSEAPNGGFTNGQHPVQPVIDFGAYTYKKVNVADEQSATSSLLNWTRKMIEIRKSCPEIAYGEWQMVNCDADGVLALLYTLNQSKVLIIHNFSSANVNATFKLDEDDLSFSDLLNTNNAPLSDGRRYTISLQGFEYRWLRMKD